MTRPGTLRALLPGSGKAHNHFVGGEKADFVGLGIDRDLRQENHAPAGRETPVKGAGKEEYVMPIYRKELTARVLAKGLEDKAIRAETNQ